MKNTAIVAGASGLIGRRIVEKLIETKNWNVIGLSRKELRIKGLNVISVDLTNFDDSQQKLKNLSGAVDIFYAARYDHPEGKIESLDKNLLMLKNLVDAIEPVVKINHIHAVHGTKYYGHPFGPVPVPMLEISPRGKVDNFYFEQEDFLLQRNLKDGWNYSISRPNTFADDSFDNPRSFGLVVAVYASIQKELNLPLDFPGSEKTFHSRTQFTDLKLLSNFCTWAATHKICRNQSFNVVNGDYPLWSELWISFSKFFKMDCGIPKAFKLYDYLKDKKILWNEITKKHDLKKTELYEVALWSYGDIQFRPDWDVISSMEKARKFGFNESVETPNMFYSNFKYYSDNKIIPSFKY